MKLDLDNFSFSNLNDSEKIIELYVNNNSDGLIDILKELKRKNKSVSLIINPDIINKNDIPYYRIIDEVILNLNSIIDKKKIIELSSHLKEYGINIKIIVNLNDSNFDTNLDIIYFAIRNNLRLKFNISDSIKNDLNKIQILHKNISLFIWDITVADMDNQIDATTLYDKQLDIYHNIHKDERCFIIGNGPSFDENAANLLKDEITIGCNAIGSAFKMWGFKPKYHCFGDWRFISEPVCWKEMLKVHKLGIPTFYLEDIYYQEATEAEQRYFLDALNQYGRGNDIFVTWPYFTEEQRTFLKNECIGIPSINNKIKIYSLRMPDKNLISYDLHKGTLMSGSVVQDTSIPIGAWLGCKEIYLIGCDMSNTGHFYNKEKTKWSVGPDVIVQFGWMQEKLQEEGKTLYNLSPSKLPKIKNLDINSLF